MRAVESVTPLPLLKEENPCVGSSVACQGHAGAEKGIEPCEPRFNGRTVSSGLIGQNADTVGASEALAGESPQVIAGNARHANGFQADGAAFQGHRDCQGQRQIRSGRSGSSTVAGGFATMVNGFSSVSGADSNFVGKEAFSYTRFQSPSSQSG